MAYDIFRGNADNAVALRHMAEQSRQRSIDSFQRCDTDGFLSQWANDISAQQFERQAEIAENGGKAKFLGLYKGDVRIAARQIEQPRFNAPWSTQFVWMLSDRAASEIGRKFIPVGKNSRVQKSLGLRERLELAPAATRLGGGGKGLSGCANAYVETYRTGCKWGTDAEACEEAIL